MKSAEIRRILEEISNAAESDKEETFSKKYPDFKQNYPVLFTKAVEGDLSKIEFMLRMLESIESNDKSQYDASASVGQMLYDEYVAPNIPARQT